MWDSTTIAVDVAKSVFEVAVSDRPGRVVERHRLSRTAFLKFLAARQPATVLLEACGSAHYWGRVAKDLGHRPVLLPPHGVRPYVLRNKTDRSDTKGLLEAHRNEDLSPVPVKSVAQQAITALHRTRSAWLATRTARINLLRGVLREFGITIPVGARNVVPKVTSLLQDPSSIVPSVVEPLLESVCAEIRELEQRIRSVELQLRLLVPDIPAAQRLMTVPGIGLLTATALVAFVGDVARFRSYLRMLLTHGARAVLRAAAVSAVNGKPLDRLRAWAVQIQRLRGHNKATIALANKLARIAWAVWRRDQPFKEVPIV